jgi:hypothetical protein
MGKIPEKTTKTPPTQKEGNVARQNKDRTPDISGDGVSLPKFTPPKER